MPWGTARSNAASAECSSCEVSGTGAAAGVLCRRFVGVAVLPVRGYFVEEESALGNHSAQSPASA